MKSTHVLLLFAHKQLRPFITLCHYHRIKKKNIIWPPQLSNPPKQPECPTSATADNSARMQVQKNTQIACFDLSIKFKGYYGYPFYDCRLYNLRKISFITRIDLQVVKCCNFVKLNIYITLLITVINYLNGQFFLHALS